MELRIGSDMFSRRSTLIGLSAVSASITLFSSIAAAQEETEEILSPLDYPPIAALTKPEPFGLHPPTKEQRDKADQIIANTPTGPRPIDIAQSFVDRFYKSDPDAISQWPLPAAWNPLIVHFFDATAGHAGNDTVPWCAAFMNWCLERAHRPSTRSASSQKFLDSKNFSPTTSPKDGDIVVYTCHSQDNGKSLGIGHVTFFKKNIADSKILVIGGNQSGKTASIICEKPMPSQPFVSRRHVGGKYIPVDYKISKFLSVPS